MLSSAVRNANLILSRYARCRSTEKARSDTVIPPCGKPVCARRGQASSDTRRATHSHHQRRCMQCTLAWRRSREHVNARAHSMLMSRGHVLGMVEPSLLSYKILCNAECARASRSRVHCTRTWMHSVFPPSQVLCSPFFSKHTCRTTDNRRVQHAVQATVQHSIGATVCACCGAQESDYVWPGVRRRRRRNT